MYKGGLRHRELSPPPDKTRGTTTKPLLTASDEATKTNKLEALRQARMQKLGQNYFVGVSRSRKLKEFKAVGLDNVLGDLKREI